MKLPGSPSQQRVFFCMLLCACLSIWSSLFYRMIHGLPQEEGALPTSSAVGAAQMPTSSPGEGDISIHYDPAFGDPFVLPAALFAATPKTSDQKEALASKPQQLEVVFPQPPALRLSGVIGETALLQGEGDAVHIGRVGERVGGVQILTVKPDHIVVRFEGRLHTLQLTR